MGSSGKIREQKSVDLTEAASKSITNEVEAGSDNHDGQISVLQTLNVAGRYDFSGVHVNQMSVNIYARENA